MNLQQLKKLSQQNEVRITSRGSKTRTPPHYYLSFRDGFSAYFKTFMTNNWSYVYYAEGMSRLKKGSFFETQVLDEEHITTSIVSFHRFFELFIKGILEQTRQKFSLKKGWNGQFSDCISNNNLRFRKESISFSEAISRYYELVALSKQGIRGNRIINKFSKINRPYAFLDNPDFKATFEFLNWWRNRIMHNGSKLPSFWYFDYIISQRVIPIVYEIVQVEKTILGDYLFFLTTPSGIDILSEMRSITFDFNALKRVRDQEDIFYKLLKIGHLKELGRASINMDFYLRLNSPSYDYYYENPHGRGARFADAERQNPETKAIKFCPNCNVQSLVVYRKLLQSPFVKNGFEAFLYAKCYTCFYYIPKSVRDPFLFKLYPNPLFEY